MPMCPRSPPVIGGEHGYLACRGAVNPQREWVIRIDSMVQDSSEELSQWPRVCPCRPCRNL